MSFPTLALGCLLLLPGQAPADVVAVKERNLNIPITFDEAHRSKIRQLILFVSRDQGRSWEQEGAPVTPDRTAFPFFAPADGMYWFNVMVIDTKNNRDPIDLYSVPPALKVLIDTMPPLMRIRTAERSGSDVVIAWEIQEANPDWNTFRLEYKPMDPHTVGSWTTVPLSGPAQLVGNTRFRVPTSGPIAVRLTLRDLATNEASAVKEIPSGHPPVSPGVPAQTPKGGNSSTGTPAPAPVPGNLLGSLPPNSAASAPSGTLQPVSGPGSQGFVVPMVNATTNSGGPSASGYTSGQPGNQSGFVAPIAPGASTAPMASAAPMGHGLATSPTSATPSSSVPAGPNFVVPTDVPTSTSPPTSGLPTPLATSTPIPPAVVREDLTPATHSTPLAVSQSGPANIAPNLPPLQVVNFVKFDLAFEVIDPGPSGIRRAELYVTRDDGRTWQRWPCEERKESPLTVDLDQRGNTQLEGIYGFKIVVQSGAGLSKGPPLAGEAPDLRIEVDVTPPVVRLYEPQADPNQRDVLILRWQAEDRNLSAEPITLEWSETATGPWRPIDSTLTSTSGSDPHARTAARRLPNTGMYAWKVPPLPTHRVYLRITCRDTAGNVAEARTPQPILVDLSKPSARIQGIIGINGATPRR